jgi:nucleoid-associated protein YgaU
MKLKTNLTSGAACVTVATGDSLCEIADMYYGACTSDNVNKIYYSNMTTIGPSKTIYPGQKLYMPD